MLDLIINAIVCTIVAIPVVMTLYLTFWGE